MTIYFQFFLLLLLFLTLNADVVRAQFGNPKDQPQNQPTAAPSSAPSSAPTGSPIVNQVPIPSGCVDKVNLADNWVNTRGEFCSDFEANPLRCVSTGNEADLVFKKTANEVCCACGGGRLRNCLDFNAFWTDSQGNFCSNYNYGTCLRWSNCCNADGITAATNCCVCGNIGSGGFGDAIAPQSVNSDDGSKNSNSSVSGGLIALCAGVIALTTVAGFGGYRYFKGKNKSEPKEGDELALTMAGREGTEDEAGAMNHGFSEHAGFDDNPDKA